MATIAPTVVPKQSVYGHTWSVSWTPLTNADVCAPVCMDHAADRSVHILGTFGSATVTIQGSNDPTDDNTAAANFLGLHDPQGVAISATAAKITEVAEIVRWFKPVFSGGDGTQSLTVNCVFRSTL